MAKNDADRSIDRLYTPRGNRSSSTVSGSSGAVDSVNGETGTVVLTTDDISEGATNRWFTAAEETKLAGIEALADVTDAGNIASSIVGVADKATPIDADTIPLIDSAAANALKKLSWANLKATLKTYFDALYGLLAAVNTWTRQQVIDGSADEVQLRVQANATQTANVQTWENSSATVSSWVDHLLRFRGTAGMYVKKGYYALTGENTTDDGMTGLYDRNEISNAALRGIVTVTITGSGTYTNTAAEKNKLFDHSAGSYFEITGTDGTTTQVVIHIDLLANQPNYNSALWQPFVQYRLLMGAGFLGTYFNNIVVECSADNATWYKPSGGEWETSDAAAEELVAGYWIGENGSLGAVGLPAWRYVRFTLTDREENAGYAFKSSIWIAELGLRHRNGVWSRHHLPMSGGDVHGDMTWTADGTAASSYNTKIQQDGGAVFNEQGADVDVRIESDNDANAFVSDASVDSIGIGVAAGSITAKAHIKQTRTTGNTLRAERDLAAASTDGPVVNLIQDNTGDDQALIRGQQDGSGAILELYDGATLVLRAADGGRLDVYNIIRALTASGLRLEDDGGNLGLVVEDGGTVVVGMSSGNANILGIKAGTSSNDAAVGGVLSVNLTDASVTDGTMQDLRSYSIPANTLAVNGQWVSVEVFGTTAANANSKTVYLYFGSTLLVSRGIGGVATAGGWVLRGKIFRTGATTQKAIGEAKYENPGSSPTHSFLYTTPAETLSSAVTVKVQGDGGAASDITVTGFVVEWGDNNT